jgi:hypothetical protein
MSGVVCTAVAGEERPIGPPPADRSGPIGYRVPDMSVGPIRVFDYHNHV